MIVLQHKSSSFINKFLLPIQFRKNSSSIISFHSRSLVCFATPMHDAISLCKADGRHNWLNRYRKKKEAIVWYKHGNAFLLTSCWAWSKSACQSLEWDNSVSRYLYLWAPRVVKVWWTGWRSSEWEGERLRKKKIRFGEILWWLKKKVHILDVVIIGLCQYFFASNRIQNLIREVLNKI